ncbi:MAG: hypothetical protein KH230_22175 [Enterocloster asparagiformis]|nr:hypothetical protein [Enterocloster asparagiformis]
MKKMIRICVTVGIVMLLTGIITTFAAVRFGGARRLGGRVRDAVHYAFDRYDDDWDHEIEDMDHWEDLWEDDFWSHDVHRGTVRSETPAVDPGHHSEGEAARYGDGSGGSAPGYAGEKAAGGIAPSGPASMEEREDGSWHVTGVAKLDIEVDRGSVRVLSSTQAADISVRIQDEAGRARCYLDEDKLKIEREVKGGRKEAKIEVIVPEDYYFDKVEVEAGAAACEISGIATRKLELQSGVSNMEFSGRVDADLEVETGVGATSLTLVGSREDFNYKVQCGAGSVNVAGDSYSSLGMEHKVDNRAAKTMELECGVGTINVQFTDSL